MGAANSDGEIIEFKNSVFMGASIERVLRNVEQEMKISVSLSMQQSYHDIEEDGTEFKQAMNFSH